MKLNPKQAPLYGECVLTVQLSEEECVEDEDDMEFYLLFSGSTQRHLTSTLRVSHVTLQAVCPAHDQDEAVRVTLCQARPGGSVDTVAEERFQYVHDLALDMAHFLIRAAANKDGLEGALLLDDSHIPVQECERLDETLTLALKHLPLPTGWSVLGTDVSVSANTDPAPHETLLHFAARRGLRRVTLFLLQQPGGRDALQLLNKHGYTPARLAQRRGHTHLQQLLSELEKSPRLETKPPRRLHPEGRAFVHHPRLNTYTLTGPNDRAGDPPDLQRDVEELRRYIQSHRQDTDSSLKHLESIPLILSPDLVGDLQTVAVTPSVGPSLPKAAECDHQEAEASELVDVARPSPWPNGSVELRGLICRVTEAGCEKRAAEGKQGDGVAVGAPSCGEQQEEEVDKDPSTIGAERQARDGPETEEPHQIQSGNAQDGSMGQTQGLLPKGTVESSENNGRRRDLPEERGDDGLRLDGERPWEQEDQMQDLNSDYKASGATEEPTTRPEPVHQLDSDREETGNLSAALTETKHHFFINSSSDSGALIPIMAPGPVNDVQLEPSAVLDQSRENVPLDTAPVCPERAAGDANKGLPATCAAVSGAEPRAECSSDPADDEQREPEALSGTSQQIRDDLSEDAPIQNTDQQKMDTTKMHEQVDSKLIEESEISEMAALLSRMHLSSGSISQDEPPDHQPDSSGDSVHAEDARSSKEECLSDEKSQNLDVVASDSSSTPSSVPVSPEGTSTLSTDPEDIISGQLTTTEPNPEITTPEEPEDKLLDGGSDRSVTAQPCFHPQPVQGASLNEPEVSESEEPVRETTFDQLKISTFEEPNGDPALDQPEVAMSKEPNGDPALDQWLEQKACVEQSPDQPTKLTTFTEPSGDPSPDQQLDGKPSEEHSLNQPEVTMSIEPIKDPSLDHCLEQKPSGEPSLNLVDMTTSEGPNGVPSIDQKLEEKPYGEQTLNQLDTTTSEDPIRASSLVEWHDGKPYGEQSLNPIDVTTFAEPNRDPSFDQLEGELCGEQSLEQPKINTSNLVDVTTSEGPNGVPSVDQKLEEKPYGEQTLNQLDTTTSEDPVRAPSLVEWHDGKPYGEQSLFPIDVTTFAEPNRDPSFDQLEGKLCGEQSLEQPKINTSNLVDVTTSEGPNGALSLDQKLEEKPYGEQTLNQLDTTTSEEPIIDPSLDQWLEEKPSGEQSLNPIDVTIFEKPGINPEGKPSVEQTLNQPEVTTSEESVGEPSLDQPEFTTSKELDGAPSLDQQFDEKPAGEQPLNLVVVTTSEEPIGEPLLDQRLEQKSSGELSLNTIAVTTSEESNGDPSLDQQLEEKPCGEQSLDQPEFTMSKELVAETPLELHPEVTNPDAVQQTGGTISNVEDPRIIRATPCFEENARIPLEPQTEISTWVQGESRVFDEPQTEVSTLETCALDPPVQDAPASVLYTSSDSGLTLDNGSTSDPLGVSTQPVDVSSPLDLDSGTSLDVEVDSGQILDSVCGVVQEEPNEELRRVDDDDDAAAEAVVAQMEQCEIHRDSEVLYSLDSDELTEQKSPEHTCTDGPSEAVCRSVSASSLPESGSDGDSLLGPDAADDNVFRQSEDSVTLTSGISVSGSISTDDSSLTHPVGGPEEEERKDRLTEVLQRSVMLRPAARSLSPSRRHSWGPTKHQPGETDLGPRSVLKREGGEKPAGHRRSMSWCPSDVLRPQMEEIKGRSHSLDGLADEEQEEKSSSVRSSTHSSTTEREDRGSLASLTEEEHETSAGDNSSLDSQRSIQDIRSGFVLPHILTKSVSMSAISHKDLDDLGPLTSAVGSLEYSICEEDPAPLRTDTEVRGTKVSRTFSYLKSKMSKKKEKDRDKSKDGKEKEKRSYNGHLFSSAPILPTVTCLQCNRPISTKEALTCTNCGVCVHKGCRDGLPACAKVKMKQQQQQTVPDSASIPGLPARGKLSSGRERPWSTLALQEDQVGLPVPPPRRNPAIMPFNSNTLSKSISISNIAGQADDTPLKLLKALSQSTDSLNKLSKVNESTESLTDEGAELMDSNLMAEFEADMKELEADSWSFTVDKKYLKQLKKDVIKRQDVIYELIQTELHHVRTLRIMADVYNKGLQKEVQLESQLLEKMFPVLDELLELHTHFLTHLLERKREAREESQSEGGFVIRRIGDVLLSQVTGSNAERMKKVYGKFCSRHNEAVNVYKELHARDKRFQAFIKRKMSSVVVRRLSIPECILLITQRITKYPVLLQRILQHTREPEEEQADVAEALRQVKEVITGVDSKVNDYEKRRRLKEVYSRTDSKSIMRMTSGQMFAREDLLRGRKLLHDGPLQLKNLAGRLKDVQALLLSDIFVFLQEKDQKYVFASLDQRSTVLHLQKLIVREVANEERGLFFITAGIEKPEMVEVHASSKEERNTWMQMIQSATSSIVDREKEDDEGIPSETEEDKRLQESKAKETRDQLQKRDEQIVALLEEKVRLFRELCDCANQDEAALRSRMMFRATGDDVTKGEPILRDALQEVDTLQDLVNSSLVGQQVCVGQDGSSGVCAGSVSLPRRSETFGGFDSHQMNISKNGDREEADDLRRTESDSVLKKGGTANLLLLHKRNSEQILQSVTHLHDLLSTLQAVVVQQDTFIEDQRHTLSSLSHRHPSISSLSSCSSSSSRPSSLMEQEKQRLEEKQREEDRRRREDEDRRRKEEEEERRRRKEEELARWEERLLAVEEENQRREESLQQEQQELSSRKEEYQRELLKLRDDQRRLEREREHHAQRRAQEEAEGRARTSSTTSEDSLKLQSSLEVMEGVEVFSRSDSKRKAKNLNPFTSASVQKGGAVELPSQIPNRLLQLAKTKDKKDKKKKKGKGGSQSQSTEVQAAAAATPKTSTDKEVYFC